MRIDDANRAAQSQALQKTNGTPQSRVKHDPATGDQADTAQISSLARSASASDPQRLERLRQDIQSGRYQVYPDRVANGIIEDVLKPGS